MDNAKDPKDALKQVFGLLETNNDTSRFVGLSLLRTLLDTHEELRNDPSVVQQCWEAIPNKFLMRLMRTGASNNAVSCGANSMRDLAIAIVHTFANLLPSDRLSEDKITQLVESMMVILARLQPASQMLAFQALQCIVATDGGSQSLLAFGDHEALRAPLTTDDRYLKEYFKTYDLAWNAAVTTKDKAALLRIIIKTITLLKAKNDSGLLEAMASLASQLEILVDKQIFTRMAELIQDTIIERPTAATRTAAIKLASEMLRRSDGSTSRAAVLFSGCSTQRGDQSKPFAYTFIQYILIDLRATIPSLMAKLALPQYTNDSLRLASCYDIVCVFIMYLMHSLEDDQAATNDQAAADMSPETLLKLRKDLSETFSLTLEFFRDRWDAVVSGVNGLDPTARSDPDASPMLTWDNPQISPEADPMILSGLRALSMWIREDDNPQLEAQATYVMDMLGALYESSMKKDSEADFRSPILVLLQGLLPRSEEAVDLLSKHNGWATLAGDLEQRLKEGFDPTISDLAQVLLAIVESDAVPQSREAWFGIVRLTAELEPQDTKSLGVAADLWQLASAIVAKAPKKLQKLNQESIDELVRKCAAGKLNYHVFARKI